LIQWRAGIQLASPDPWSARDTVQDRIKVLDLVDDYLPSVQCRLEELPAALRSLFASPTPGAQ